MLTEMRCEQTHTVRAGRAVRRKVRADHQDLAHGLLARLDADAGAAAEPILALHLLKRRARNVTLEVLARRGARKACFFEQRQQARFVVHPLVIVKVRHSPHETDHAISSTRLSGAQHQHVHQQITAAPLPLRDWLFPMSQVPSDNRVDVGDDDPAHAVCLQHLSHVPQEAHGVVSMEMFEHV